MLQGVQYTQKMTLAATDVELPRRVGWRVGWVERSETRRPVQTSCDGFRLRLNPSYELTHDRRIRYKPNERDAVMRHGVGLLVIVGATPFAELARAFLATLPNIEHFLDNHEPPFIAKVYRPPPGDTAQRTASPGRVELWYPW